MLDWIEAHQAAVLLVFAGVVGTVGLLLLTIALRLMRLLTVLLVEVRRTREAERRPQVFVDLVVDGPILSLALRNLGRQPAIGLQLSFEPELVARREAERMIGVRALPIGSRIEFLGPDAVFDEFLNASAFEFFRLNAEVDRVIGKVTYQDPAGTPFESPWTLDLAAWRRRQYVIHRNLDDLCRTVDDLRLAVQDLPDRLRSPEV